MKRPFIILFVLLSAILFAGERGLTVKEIEVSGEAISISSPVQSLIQEAPLRKVEKAETLKNWDTLQELNLNFRLPAKGQYGLQFIDLSQSVQPFGFPGCLSETAFQAVNKAPVWVQTELASILAELIPEKQTLWSNLILSAQDPYVDEICFCIANSSPQYLNSAYALPELYGKCTIALFYRL